MVFLLIMCTRNAGGKNISLMSGSVINRGLLGSSLVCGLVRGSKKTGQRGAGECG